MRLLSLALAVGCAAAIGGKKNKKAKKGAAPPAAQGMAFEEVFAAFDHDRSGGWDEDELKQMLSSADLAKKDVPTFKALDLDKDGTLGQNEVAHLFPEGMTGKVPMGAQDEFEYTDVNGQKKRISREEMTKRVEEQQKYKMVDGVMMKEDSGESKLDQLAKENPAMARFVEIGKFAHKELNSLGYAVGNITNFASSPRRHKTEEDMDMGHVEPGVWAQSIIITVSEKYQKDGHPSTRSVKYECVVRADKKKYRRKAALIQAWVVDSSSLERQEPEIHVPEPEPPQFLERNGPALVTICGVIICSAIARWLRTGATLAWSHFTKGDGGDGGGKTGGDGEETADVSKEKKGNNKKKGKKTRKAD